MRLLHTPTLPTNDAGVVNAMLRSPAPGYREGHRRADAPRYGPFASP